MARYTPQFIAGVRHDYENTDKSLDRIAIDHGISERTVNRMRDREGWARRSERVRDVPPATQALQEATTLLAAQASAAAGDEAGVGWAKRSVPTILPSQQAEASHADGRVGTAPEPALGRREAPIRAAPLPTLPETERPPRSAIERIERLVQRELEAEEAVRARLGPLARAPADAERCARTLATLTQTLHALTRLRAGLEPDRGLPDDDMPRDINEFRHELARRIRAFVQSRTGGGLRDGVSVADDVARRP